MDRCYAEKAAPNNTSHLNSVDVMQNERKPHCSGKPTDAGKETTLDMKTPIGDAALDMKTPIGVAHLDDDGSTIIVDMRRTPSGMHVSGMVRYAKDSPYYKQVWDHLEGLKTGESKLVLPFRDDEK